MAGILLKNVTKKYGKVPAVDRINLTVRDMEFVVLVGPSGCGKSTTLRMIAGLEQATEGQIYIGDRDVSNVPPKNRDIAMVFQNYALYPHMNVYKNMSFGLRIRKFPKQEIDKRVEEAAKILGIGDLLDRKPKELSGGQRQRVAMGRAIVRQPQAFLFDEPLSNLDAKLRVQMRAELARLHQRLKKTIIYVTHDQVEAMTLATQIVVMNQGQIMQIGAPKDVYKNPGNRFVAGFIGSPSMNFFDGTLVAEEGKVFVDTGDFRVEVPEDRKAKYEAYKGKGVILGIRPEHIHAPQYAPSGIIPAKIEATIEIIELLGHELNVIFNSGKNTFIATVDTRMEATIGNKIPLVFDMHNMHLFDKETEKAIR